MFYRVKLRDGSSHENLRYDEVLPFLQTKDWDKVEYMSHGNQSSKQTQILRENMYGKRPGML